MWSILRESIRILNESAPYLLFGYLAAGLLSVLLARYQRINSLLAAPGRRPVFLAALIGAPLPLCSCSVLPTALALRRQGAGKGTTASFLISVPETDIVSILLTYALLGPVIAVFRPLAAVITAVTTGLVIRGIETRDAKRPATAAGTEETPSPVNDRADSAAVIDEAVGTAADSPRQKRGWVSRALHFGFVEMFDDIMLQLLLGIVLAGAVVAWLPDLGVASFVGGTPITYLIMLVIGIPVYVCATASTPLAVGLIAAGVSPGAALVFLLAGPATNIASLLVLHRQFGRRILAAYLATIALVSVFMGLWLDTIIGPGYASTLTEAGPLVEGGPSAIEIASTVIILLLTALSIRRTRLLERCTAAVNKRFSWSIGSKKFLLVIGLLLFIGYMMSGVFVIEAGERGATKIFGRVDAAYLEPGLHYRWPVPIGSADVESVDTIRRLEIGLPNDTVGSDEPAEPNLPGTSETPPGTTWILAGDENIVDIQCVVHYQIIDTREAFLDYLYGVKDKSQLVTGAAEWALRTSVAGRSIDSLLTVDRDAVEKTMRDELLQPRLDACRAGIRIVDVTLESVHAPPPVHWAFRDVASAAEDQKQTENLAQGYREKTTLEAEGEAARMLAVAEGTAAERTDVARGSAYAFEAESAAWREGPDVMETRLYLEWLDTILPRMNKYVDLMPRKYGATEVWLRMGPESKAAPPEEVEAWPFPWDRQEEDKK